MKAVFLDQDGVVNRLICYREQGVIDSPFTAAQFQLLPGVSQAINKFHEMGDKVVLISNQPGIAKGHMSQKTFEEIKSKMREGPAREGASLGGEYYCFHHPEAKIKKLKAHCECQKPKPGLLLQAAREMDIDLPHSWMIGDGLTDVKAGKDAGARTILVGRMKCEFCHLMGEEDARPDAVCAELLEAANVIGIRA